ncbi:hypothetical protein [Actinomycetospora chibensis]|uniref:Sigma-70 family RNA polymerase sigma factor n=1 Tax=Actinomycetospora chibensis TaxID=663606 RepID=A0ABV9RJ63_9PSEU|nr:hypothetical protein [Actinomycetospora chibensis]MDD7923872.1 hypothetical protein [Actinomycetospora chibensis]
MSEPDAEEFHALRREPDPIIRGRRATELLALYQQRSTELARLRRAAIEEARDQLGGSYTEVAKAFGLTKGRITQIRQTAPVPERAFYGVGPITIAIPGRVFPGRRDLVIASEDDETADIMTAELHRLAFHSERYRVDPEQPWTPAGDAVVICGPVSAPVGGELLARDPVLSFVQLEGGRWVLERRDTGEQFASPIDDDRHDERDVAYLARHQGDDHVIVHLAGVHALGSIAAATHLAAGLQETWREMGETSFSMVVRGTFEDQKPTRVDVLAGPIRWS